MTAKKTPPPRPATQAEIVDHINALHRENAALAAALERAIRYGHLMATLLDEAGIPVEALPDDREKRVTH